MAKRPQYVKYYGKYLDLLWIIVNVRRKSIEKLLINGHSVNDANDIANVFNECYSHVGKSLSDKLPIIKTDH